VGDAVQPARASTETPAVLDEYQRRLEVAFAMMAERFRAAEIETVVALVTDHGSVFDRSNTPQLHIHCTEDVWGNTALGALGEEPRRITLRCDTGLAGFLAEELVSSGFDISESRGDFVSLGDPTRGIDPSLVEFVEKLAPERDRPPLVIVHVNCHTEPCISGERMAAFGTALANALALDPTRTALIASGGMSGDPHGYMAGWIDDMLDEWVLSRLRTGRSSQIGPIFKMDSLTLRGSTRELRLWCAVGAAMEQTQTSYRTIDYIPLHHSAVGTGFATWE
jgi:protocatechuate 4,5-dioxygenase beta chain